MKFPELTKKQKKVLIISSTFLIILLIFLWTVQIVQAPINVFEEKSEKHNFKINLNFLEKKDLVVETEKLPESEPEVKIIFGGDVMLSRTVNAKMAKYNDYTWPFREILEFLKTADINVINLESPFLKNSSYNVLSGSFSFKANPLAVIGLKEAGINLVSLANNHTLNQGEKGIKDTIDILEENNIYFTGAGLNKEAARKPAFIEKNGLKFAFFSYAYPDDYSVASEKRAGIANMNIEEMAEDISILENSEQAPDFIIVLMHAGIEYVVNPNWQQENFARAAIDAGADLVVGHHPHWPQKFEFYKDKPIIYSLGNLVFDQMWSEETRQGLLLESTWQKELKSLRLIPTKIYDYGQVKILDETIENENRERLKILEKIGAAENALIYER